MCQRDTDIGCGRDLWVTDMWGGGHGYGGHGFVGAFGTCGVETRGFLGLGLPALVAARVQGFCPLVCAVGLSASISASGAVVFGRGMVKEEIRLPTSRTSRTRIRAR